MPITRLRGVIPAHLTPFKNDGALDEHALCNHVAGLASTHGVTAIMSNGHAGEAEALSRAEKRHVLDLVLETVGSKIPVLAGLVARNEEEGVCLAADARMAGAAALVVFPLPFWRSAPLRQRFLMHYLDRLVLEGRLPLLIFQHSIAGGNGYESETLIDACRHPGVIGVLEGSGTPLLYETHLRRLAQLPRPPSILTTHSTWLLSSLALGGDGILSGMSSVVAPLHVALLDAIERSHLPGARAINDQIWPLTQVFYNTPGTDPHSLMKLALHLLGRLPSPTVRPPLSPPPLRYAVKVEQALLEARLLKPVLS